MSGIRFSNKNIAVFYLVFMCIAIVPLEGYTVSNLKVAAMALTPFLLFLKSPVISKATVFGWLQVFVLVNLLLLKNDDFRMSTILYKCLFVAMFNLYYNLVYAEKAFSIAYFSRVLQFIILAYTVCLIMQQAAVLIGIRRLLIINLMGASAGSFKLNSLAIEPSHAARILAVCFFAFLKITEYTEGRILPLRELYGKYKWIILGFVYSMITMNSGTAIVGFAIVSLYFVKRQYLFFILPTLLVLYFVIPIIDYEPLNRAMDTLNATLTGDPEEVVKADHSASARVNILLNTWNHLDITSSETWWGYGMDAGMRGKIQMIGGITDYGLIYYIVSLIFVYTCCFRNFLSIETVMLFTLFGGGIGNFAYGWGMLMLFSTVKYFSLQTSLNNDE